jgi:hypothetical protein
MLYPLWSCPTAAGEDDVIYYYPLHKLVAEQVRAGQLPMWNQYEATGVPLFADPQNGLCFPPNWLFLVLPMKLAYSLAIFLAFGVAGAGAYVYLRRLGLAPPAAVFGSLAFMFSGFMVGHRVHLAMIQTAALLPWLLFAVEKIRDSFRAGLAWLTPVFALMLAAGHWPTAIMMSVAWGAYLLLRARPWPRAILVAAVAVALGSAMLAPQLAATLAYVNQSARGHIPLAVAAENSFFPLNAVLAFFPFILGCRTPSAVCPQDWWGPWHLCETLGYVGLATLVLAAAAMWRLCRKPRGSAVDGGPALVPAGDVSARAIACTWTVLLVASAVWALGSYLYPVFWVIHHLPLLGSVRCPARMLLVIDMGLATLAALAINSMLTAPELLAGTIRRAAKVALPAAMLAALGLVLLAKEGQGPWWDIRQLLSWPADGTDPVTMLGRSLDPFSPAIFVPVLMAIGSAAALLWFLKAPPRRAWLLVGVLLVDLCLIARFVDVPAGGKPMPDPENSPAAKWLAENGAKTPYRVWGLDKNYHTRAAELLLPKTAASLGVSTISYYGPFQPVELGQMFGFRPWGANEDWEGIIRRNHLLSLMNVRYVLAADADYRRVIESVRVPTEPATADGANLLTGSWQLNRAQRDGGAFRLQTPWSFSPALAIQNVEVEPGAVYRIALDVCAPDGAGNYVSAECYPADGSAWPGTPSYLRVDIEQVTAQWRHFERAFTAPANGAAAVRFQLLTMSDTPIEIRNVTLRRSSLDRPIDIGQHPAPGAVVYQDLTPGGLAPVRGGDDRVHIYENTLCLPRNFPVGQFANGDTQQVIEAIRWEAGKFALNGQVFLPPGRELKKGSDFVSEDRATRAALYNVGDGTIRADGLGAVCPPTESGASYDVQKAYWVWLRPKALLSAGAILCWLALVLLVGGRKKK